MLKKFIKVIVIFITLFYFCIDLSFAYEYHDRENESGVNDLIREVYDAKEQYEDLFGEYENASIEMYNATSDLYWWPIGSKETTSEGDLIFATGTPETLTVTSNFGKRKDPFGQDVIKNHTGIDIAGGSGAGSVNIIAAKDGIVVYPNKVGGDCPFSKSQSNCGAGYGNYVVIQHSDGNYTLYAHLHQDSIIVKSGDSVKQGQVIAKMGSSGNSTGPHLHFEIRQGTNEISAVIDPTRYIDSSNPRQSVQAIDGNSNQQTICLTLKNRGYDDNAVIAILQNFHSESGFNSMNLQNSYQSSLGYTDETYTSAVDSGSYKNFVHDAAGYGLAQWTYWGRKEKLFNYVKKQKSSIGDLNVQLEFFLKELEGYAEVNNYLLNVSHSYQDKTYNFCAGYEKPANTQSTCKSRANSSSKFLKYVKNGCN